jgi:hypothetical protein
MLLQQEYHKDVWTPVPVDFTKMMVLREFAVPATPLVQPAVPAYIITVLPVISQLSYTFITANAELLAQMERTQTLLGFASPATTDVQSAPHLHSPLVLLAKVDFI